MKIISSLSKKDLSGKKVLARVDFNVPIRNGKVVESMRIDEALPTIKFLLKNGAQVILVSHLGGDGQSSLRPVAKYLAGLKFKIKFIDDLESIAKTKEPLVLFENIRRLAGEQENDSALAKKLTDLADLYVNEAFSVCHRQHASVVGVPKFLPSYAGLRLAKEIAELKKIDKPVSPLAIILGGAKFKTKFPLLKKFLPKVEVMCVGGALANTLIKARGQEVGVSLIDEITPEIKKLAHDKKIILPIDFVVVGRQKSELVVKKVDELSAKDKIVDLGPRTAKLFGEKISDAKTILWNGPLGLVEEGFIHGTIAMARSLPKGTFSVLGGGDSVEALRQAKLLKKPSFVSTGGGAMLEFLVTGSLPGIKALS
ncbi:MAG: phosphoglycerate kinase [Candidatus Vogelbacteria bacterium RIFOXYB1_FULL_42_16]|uniref:Phosphoglycerate kinase n=1 Tax=Candidatus Vogelbacteria bacterium RIFOXYB1_FULL_42_16 TaxID=1802436 RepID=A0A1G2QC04_9BACT|nr:MAG: phosphoglycerate kinase [Candidatus Vogelbacteria bacterium RIFOXYB1_FULL_42_16]